MQDRPSDTFARPEGASSRPYPPAPRFAPAPAAVNRRRLGAGERLVASAPASWSWPPPFCIWARRAAMADWQGCENSVRCAWMHSRMPPPGPGRASGQAFWRSAMQAWAREARRCRRRRRRRAGGCATAAPAMASAEREGARLGGGVASSGKVSGTATENEDGGPCQRSLRWPREDCRRVSFNAAAALNRRGEDQARVSSNKSIIARHERSSALLS